MIKVKAKYIVALYPFINVKDHRDGLRGVRIEPAEVGGVYLIATDGHRMGIAHDALGECAEAVIYKIDSAFVASCKAKSGEVYERVVTFEGDRATIASDDGVTHAVSLVEVITAQFPDWQALLSHKRTGSGDVMFNAAYAGDFAKSAKALGRTGTRGSDGSPIISVMGNGENATLVRFHGIDDFFAVLMPVQGKAEWKLPEWIG